LAAVRFLRRPAFGERSAPEQERPCQARLGHPQTAGESTA
jgi:hypothetical protein